MQYIFCCHNICASDFLKRILLLEMKRKSRKIFKKMSIVVVCLMLFCQAAESQSTSAPAHTFYFMFWGTVKGNNAVVSHTDMHRAGFKAVQTCMKWENLRALWTFIEDQTKAVWHRCFCNCDPLENFSMFEDTYAVATTAVLTQTARTMWWFSASTLGCVI